MTINVNPDPRFALDLADRMQKAVRYSGLGVQELADRLDVSRNAVSSWINGRHRPRPRDLKAFALATGYPVQWLETGEAPHDGGAPGGGSESHLRESNPRPIHYMRRSTDAVHPIRKVA